MITTLERTEYQLSLPTPGVYNEAELAAPASMPEAYRRELGDWALRAQTDNAGSGAGGQHEITETKADTATGGYAADEAGVPPTGMGSAEQGEDEPVEIARCNFREFFKQKLFGDEWADDEQITGFERKVENALGDHGYYVRLLIREIRSNYFDHCAVDIYAGVDSGNRLLKVSKNKAGDIFIDYFDDDEVTSRTYNMYAKLFGQDLELIDGQIPEEVTAASPEAERATSLTQLEEVTDTSIDRMLVFGNTPKQRDVGEGGRGTPLIMKYTDIHKIQRCGPDNRGACLRLRMKREIPPLEDIFQVDYEALGLSGTEL